MSQTKSCTSRIQVSGDLYDNIIRKWFTIKKRVTSLMRLVFALSRNAKVLQ